MMEMVDSGDSEPKPPVFQLTEESRLAIIQRTKDLRLRMQRANSHFRNFLNMFGLPSENQYLIRGGPNQIVPTNHDLMTLTRQARGSEAVDPAMQKIRLRIGVTVREDDGEEVEIPTNDVFLEVVKTDDTRDLYLVNSEGFWVYEAAEQVRPIPDGDIYGNFFEVDARVDQSGLTQQRFEDLELALELFQPFVENNRSAGQ